MCSTAYSYIFNHVSYATSQKKQLNIYSMSNNNMFKLAVVSSITFILDDLIQ